MRRILFYIFSLFLIFNIAYSAEIILNDGQELKGEIKGIRENAIEIEINSIPSWIHVNQIKEIKLTKEKILYLLKFEVFQKELPKIEEKIENIARENKEMGERRKKETKKILMVFKKSAIQRNDWELLSLVEKTAQELNVDISEEPKLKEIKTIKKEISC